MIIVQSTFTAKPGQAGKLVTQIKEMVAAGGLRSARVLTDLSGGFNTVVMEHEVESLAEWEGVMQRYSTDPEIRKKVPGYTDLWLTGHREFFRVA